MPDDMDLAQEREQIARDAAIKNNAKPLDPGIPGDCDICAEWSGRLIGGACAPCRDRFKLP